MPTEKILSTKPQSSSQFFAGVREPVATIVVGQDVVVVRVMIALLTGGDLLLRGLPGLAKTVSDCTLGVGHGMSIGSYTSGGLRDITGKT